MSLTLAPEIDYTAPATSEIVAQTAEALRARGIKVEIVDSPAAALATIERLIPDGATIMSGASKSLQDIGFEQKLIDKDHAWINLKDSILAETDQALQGELRRQSILAPYYLGSVQAIAETGEIVIASASGSQLPAYAFSSQNVIWVAGVQKIVPTLEDALRRLRDYAVPIENERIKTFGYPGTVLAKILIVENEPAMLGRNVTLILVNEPVGV